MDRKDTTPGKKLEESSGLSKDSNDSLETIDLASVPPGVTILPKICIFQERVRRLIEREEKEEARKKTANLPPASPSSSSLGSSSPVQDGASTSRPALPSTSNQGAPSQEQGGASTSRPALPSTSNQVAPSQVQGGASTSRPALPSTSNQVAPSQVQGESITSQPSSLSTINLDDPSELQPGQGTLRQGCTPSVRQVAAARPRPPWRRRVWNSCCCCCCRNTCSCRNCAEFCRGLFNNHYEEFVGNCFAWCMGLLIRL